MGDPDASPGQDRVYRLVESSALGAWGGGRGSASRSWMPVHRLDVSCAAERGTQYAPRYLTSGGDVNVTFRRSGQRMDEDGMYVGDSLYRLREGIERFFITDINNPAASAIAQSEVPIMWDTWGDTTRTYGALPGNPSSGVIIFNHVPGGSNVLYMDGHVEFVRHKVKYPIKDDPPGTWGADYSGYCALGAGFG